MNRIEAQEHSQRVYHELRNNPDLYPEDFAMFTDEYRTNCCNEKIEGGRMDGMGICSKCKELSPIHATQRHRPMTYNELRTSLKDIAEKGEKEWDYDKPIPVSLQIVRETIAKLDDYEARINGLEIELANKKCCGKDPASCSSNGHTVEEAT